MWYPGTGPPRRHKYIVNGKRNSRDTSTWVYRETINGYIGADRIAGTCNYYVDFQDSPDRYYISNLEVRWISNNRRIILYYISALSTWE